MKKKFTITDFSPPPKMKRKKRFTRNELLQLKKNKKGKKEILHLQNIKKKRGFTIAEHSPKPIMRKKIKRLSLPIYTKVTKTKFLIEDVILPPKYIKKTKTKFLIEDVHSPPKPSSNSPPKRLSSPPKPISRSVSLDIVENPYCSCSGDCAWCQLHRLLEKSAIQNGKGIIAHKIRKYK